ncbi:hypothetical protein ABPG72_013586 [Tetrahymena utriculariae]
MADGNEQQQQQLVKINDTQGDKQIIRNQYISVNNKDIKQINDKKELLELDQIKSTRKLYVEGDNINKLFAQFLTKATKTQIAGVQLAHGNHQQQHSLLQQAQQQSLVVNNEDAATNKGVSDQIQKPSTNRKDQKGFTKQQFMVTCYGIQIIQQR